MNEYIVREIDVKIARDMVKKYHYSKKVVNNSYVHLGVFKQSDFFEDELVGVLQFGYSMNHLPTGKKTSSTHYQKGEFVELNRMVMADSEPRNSESMAISKCMKYLKKNYPDIAWVISFSDGKENNVGYIYQATNWLYLGFFNTVSFFDCDGKYIHKISLWNRYKEKSESTKTMIVLMCESGDFKNIKLIQCKQHLYVLPLKKGVKFNYEKRAYPKLETETPILNEKVLMADGVVVKTPQWAKKHEKLDGETN